MDYSCYISRDATISFGEEAEMEESEQEIGK